MLKECLKIFKKELNEKGEGIIIDTYVPAEGTYIIVSPKDDSYEIKEAVNIKYNKKTKELEGKANKYFNYLCECDYNSALIEMNKPIDGKKIIHSNNYLSFWIKKESLSNGKLTNDIIDNFYSVLSNPEIKYSKKPKQAALYKAVEEEIGRPDAELIDRIKLWIKDNIFNLDVEIRGKDYLKIFFEYPIDEYKREGRRYLVPNIYNSNDYNVEVNNKIFGLPSDNMGLNAKKPYLENKSRKISVPYLIDEDEVILQKKFFDYLMNNAAVGKYNLYINTDDDCKRRFEFFENGNMQDSSFNGLYLRIQKGMEVEIHDYDVISGYRYNLSTEFTFKKIIDFDASLINSNIPKYGKCRNLGDLQNLLNEVLFSKCLKNNYFTEPKDINITDSSVKSNLLLSKGILFNYFYKGVDNGVEKLLDKVSLNLVKGSIANGYRKAIHQFNLRWSLKEYFKKGNDNMADTISSIKDSLRNKINSEYTDSITNDTEYYFAVGQMVSYLLSKNKGKKKVQSLANPFINGKNNEVIKEKLRNFYKRYNYDIDMSGKRFKNLYAMILSYEPDSKVDQDMIIAGYLHSNLIYESNKKGDVVNE
ncbi:MAG TPA: type I-B CRISPR-associated protein Cas8b/Csh1 [Clostridium sp.]|nr:type I-B CRISPR-associated protein Cas8b/Csh1 [Clostridium sp.]